MHNNNNLRKTQVVKLMKNSVSDLSDSHLLWQSGSSRVCVKYREALLFACQAVLLVDPY